MFNQDKNITDHHLFGTLSKEEKNLFENDLKKVSSPAGECFFMDNKNLDHIYFIEQGSILVGRNYGNQNKYATHLYMQPMFLGIESLLISSNDEFAKSLTNIYYARINSTLFLDVLKKNVHFHDTIRKQIAYRLDCLEMKYNLLHGNVNFTDRLKHFFIELAELNDSKSNDEILINLHFTHFEIAQYLHSSRQSISSGLSKMRKKGMIDYGRNWMKIIDLEKLKCWDSS